MQHSTALHHWVLHHILYMAQVLVANAGENLLDTMVCVRFYLTLNITPELIKPELLLLTRITLNLSLQSCPPSAANTMLGIYYTYVALCCSAHGCCAVECGVACCTTQHKASATLTLPRTRLVAYQYIQQHQKNTPTSTLTLGGLIAH